MEVIDRLFEARDLRNEYHEQGIVPLHFATLRGRAEIPILLSGIGADRNTTHDEDRSIQIRILII